MHLSPVLAVDCGASHVAVGRFSRRGGRLRPIRFASEALALEQPGDEAWAAAVGSALGAIGRREDLHGACVVGLPAHLTLSKVVRLPRVRARQCRRLVRFEVGRYAPCPLAELAWSHAQVAAEEDGQELVVTAARVAMVRLLCERMRRAGFYPAAVIPSWRALDAVLGRSASVPAPQLAVGIGARTTQVICRGKPRVFLRSIALGGDLVTQAIAEELGTSAVAAEALKHRVVAGAAGLATDAPESMAVQMAAEQFVQRLTGEISRTLAGACPGGGETRPSQLLLTGGGSLLPDLPRALEQNLHVRVGRGAAFAPPGTDFAATGAMGWLEAGHLNELAGLAECATARGAGSSSLLPAAMRRELWVRRWWPGLAAAALALIVGSALAAGYFRAAARETQRQTAGLEVRIATLRRLEARNRANLARLAEVNRRLAALQRAADAKTNWIALLADLQERLVKLENVWFEHLQVLPADGHGAPAPPVTAAAPRLRLAGCLLDPDHPLAKPGTESSARARMLVASLGRSPFVAAIENERFDAGQAGVLRFELTLVLRPRASL